MAYEHWGKKKYDPTERRELYLSQRHKCESCDRLVGRYNVRCRKCSAIRSAAKRIGKTLPKEWADKIRASHPRGANHPNWKGGISPINKIIRRSKEFIDWRRQVFERDRYTCQHCGIRGGILHPDHIKPFSLFPELRFELSNGRTLCVSCHRKTPTWGNAANNMKREDFEYGGVGVAGNTPPCEGGVKGSNPLHHPNN